MMHRLQLREGAAIIGVITGLAISSLMWAAIAWVLCLWGLGEDAAFPWAMSFICFAVALVLLSFTAWSDLRAGKEGR
jgi:hypothetical protein